MSRKKKVFFYFFTSNPYDTVPFSVEHAESWSIPGAEAGYIYEVDAVFENGTVSYGFEVKK